MNDFCLDLSPEEAEKIVGFLGYGRISAPIWFIGLEEGLGKMSDDDAKKNLKARSTFNNVMDLREAHLNLLEGGRYIDIELDPPSTQVWKYIAKIMLARDGHRDWRDRETVVNYIKSHLGRKNDDTFLTELSSIPKGRNADTRWMTKFAEIVIELPKIIRERKEELKRLSKLNPPSLIICYGKRPDEFGGLLGVDWHPVCDGVWKSQDSKCLLLPFFGQGHMRHSVIESLLQRGLLSKQT